MVVEGVFLESNLEQATPLGIVAHLEVESDGDEKLDARDADCLRPEGSHGVELDLGQGGLLVRLCLGGQGPGSVVRRPASRESREGEIWVVGRSGSGVG